MSTAYLDRLLEITRNEPELYAWLTRALARYRQGERLERALGLAGARAVLVRNATVRRVADLIDRDGSLRPWPRAAEVARRVRHFEATAWPRLRAREDRDELPALKKALLEWLEIEQAEGVRPVRCQLAIYRLFLA